MGLGGADSPHADRHEWRGPFLSFFDVNTQKMV